MKRSRKKSPQEEFYKAKLKQDERHHKERLEQQERFHKEGAKQSYHAQTLAIIMAIIAIGAFFLTYTSAQAGIISAQTSIAALRATLPTLAPVEPSLEVTLADNKEPVIFAKFEVNIQRDEKNNPYNQAMMIFKVVNRGQMDSGAINFFLRGNWTEKDKIYDSRYVGNIERFNYTYVYFHLLDERCIEPDSNCTVEDIPNGTQKVTLETSCSGCNPQDMKQEYTVCIWGKSMLNECVRAP